MAFCGRGIFLQTVTRMREPKEVKIVVKKAIARASQPRELLDNFRHFGRTGVQAEKKCPARQTSLPIETCYFFSLYYLLFFLKVTQPSEISLLIASKKGSFRE